MEKNYLNKTFSLKKQQYQIVERIGAGSHSTVWKARERFYPHKEITIKIARKQQGITHERLKNELWFLKEIEHANIPKLLGSGEMEGCLWLAMPTFRQLSLPLPMHGELKKIRVGDIRPKGYPRMARKVPLAAREELAIAILIDISNAISYIAGTGIVHADISPGNIMEKKGSVMNKQYVLTDWGASALIHRYPEDSFGSLHFTAPERLFGEVSHKSDLFSLGVVCYYILTGTVPYTGKTGELYYLSIVERDGISPSALEPVNSALDRLIRDLIRQRGEQRPEPNEVCKRIDKISFSQRNKIFHRT